MNLIADEKRVVEAFGEAEERNGVYGTWARELSIRDVQKRVRELFPRGTGEVVLTVLCPEEGYVAFLRDTGEWARYTPLRHLAWLAEG